MSAPLEMLRAVWRRVNGISPWLRMLALLAAFTAVIGGMIWQQMRLLRSGREVIVPMRPVDPRDLFHGHYVRLGYDFSRAEVTKIRDFAPADRSGSEIFPPVDRIYVVLKKDAEHPPFWELSHFLLKRPARQKEGEVFLRCNVTAPGPRDAGLRCGIERFYAPKEKARALERELGGRWRFDQKLGRTVLKKGASMPGVILRVDEEGRAAIAGLYIDGRRLMIDGLF